MEDETIHCADCGSDNQNTIQWQPTWRAVWDGERFSDSGCWICANCLYGAKLKAIAAK